MSVTQDTTAPTVTSVSPDVTSTALVVRYSEPVSATAEAKANYALDKGATIASVTRVSETTVQLTTSKLAEGTEYTLAINDVQDTASPANPIAAGTKATFKSFVFVPGAALHNMWENTTANSIAGLTNDTRFPSAPTWSSVVPMFEYPANGGSEAGSNYGNELVTWFIPPTSGNYVFFTCSDDASSLYLSTDDNPANKKLIASESRLRAIPATGPPSVAPVSWRTSASTPSPARNGHPHRT